MSITMDARLEHWRATDVSECLDLGDYDASIPLRTKLWDIYHNAEMVTPEGGDGSDGTVETPDGQMGDFGDKAPQWWGRLTDKEKTTVNAGIEKYEDVW